MLQSLRKRVLSPSALALLLHRASRSCQARHLLFVARAVMLLGRFLTGIEINTGAVIGRDLLIKHGMGTVIGGHCRIGDDCVLFHNVTLGQAGPDGGMPTLGNRVIVYAGAVIAGPISIGDDAIIGANAVVLTDVPAGATVGGVPAKPVHGGRRVGVHEPVS